MKRPLHSGNDFLQDVHQAGGRPEELHVWWLGQSGFLVKWGGRHLLFDPYLSDSLTKKYAGTEKPHVRMTERVIAPDRLEFIDVVTSTHNHTDHLDAETLLPLLQVNKDLALLIPEANRAFVADRLRTDPSMAIGLDAGQTVRVGDVTASAIPAAHEELERDEEGRYHHLGYVVEVGPWTVYHSGDTVRYEGMIERLAPWDIDIAILPINGRDPARGIPGNLSGPETAQLGRDINAGIVIPCHFDMFEFNTVSPDPFVRECDRIGQDYVLLQNGGRWSGAK